MYIKFYCSLNFIDLKEKNKVIYSSQTQQYIHQKIQEFKKQDF